MQATDGTLTFQVATSKKKKKNTKKQVKLILTIHLTQSIQIITITTWGQYDNY